MFTVPREILDPLGLHSITEVMCHDQSITTDCSLILNLEAGSGLGTDEQSWLSGD